MNFLVNASPPNLLAIATSNFVPDLVTWSNIVFSGKASPLKGGSFKLCRCIGHMM